MKVNTGQYFKVAANFLLKKEVPFKFEGTYLTCHLFTLTSHVDLSKMWIEDDSGAWRSFTDISVFKEYLNKRFPSVVPNRKI